MIHNFCTRVKNIGVDILKESKLKVEKKIIGLFQECWHSKMEKERRENRKKLFKTLSKNISYMARKMPRG